jgi:hypothetical protein
MIAVAHAHRMFAAANEPKELWLYEGVDHCGAYFADRSGYVERVHRFFEQALRTENRELRTGNREPGRHAL